MEWKRKRWENVVKLHKEISGKCGTHNFKIWDGLTNVQLHLRNFFVIARERTVDVFRRVSLQEKKCPKKIKRPCTIWNWVSNFVPNGDANYRAKIRSPQNGSAVNSNGVLRKTNKGTAHRVCERKNAGMTGGIRARVLDYMKSS